jgi:glycolate oxidase FAD binding subunit
MSSTAVVEQTWMQRLEAVGAADTSAEVREQFAVSGVTPGAVVFPASPEEVADIVRFANDNSLSVIPVGGGTQQGYGHPPAQYDLALSTSRLDQVRHYDPGDLTVGIDAGMTVAQVQQFLAEHDQFLPLDPLLPERATIGGMLAANSHGPWKAGFGGVRDFCIGVHFVTGDGKMAKGGGKVVKNVAGYDLMKLLIGSFGTLGVITSANFKVFPRPQGTRTFVAEFNDLEKAMGFRDRVAASSLHPARFELLSPRMDEYLSDRPARDADHYSPEAPLPAKDPWRLCIQAAGSEAVLRRFKVDLQADITRELDGPDEAAFWGQVSGFEDSFQRHHRNALLLRMHVAPASLRRAMEVAERCATDHNMIFAATGRANVGAMLLGFAPIPVDPPSAATFVQLIAALRNELPDSSLFVAACPTEVRPLIDVWGGTPTDLALMSKIRQAMDPKQVLNRGRFVVR